MNQPCIHIKNKKKFGGGNKVENNNYMKGENGGVDRWIFG